MFKRLLEPWLLFILTGIFLALMSWKPANPQTEWPKDHPINKNYVPAEPPAKITIVPVTPNKPPTTPPRQSKIFPPEQYDHYYEGDLRIEIVETQEELFTACNQRDPLMMGCAYRYAKNCVIYMVKDEIMRKHGWTTGILIRHEIGHCNGWPNDHPGVRPITWPSPQLLPADQRVRPRG